MSAAAHRRNDEVSYMVSLVLDVSRVRRARAVKAALAMCEARDARGI